MHIHVHVHVCIYTEQTIEKVWVVMSTNFHPFHYTIVHLPPHLTIERVCYSAPVLLPVSPSFTPSHRCAVLVEISEIAQVCCPVCSDELWRHAQHECRLPWEKCVYIYIVCTWCMFLRCSLHVLYRHVNSHCECVYMCDCVCVHVWLCVCMCDCVCVHVWLCELSVANYNTVFIVASGVWESSCSNTLHV